MAIFYTKKEERINWISHAAGVVLALTAGILLLVYACMHDHGWAQCGIWLYMAGMLGSYLSSTLYHACPQQSRWREPLRRLDHAAIYWHIAGSYSPITLVALRAQGAWGWALFGFQWGAALLGTVLSLRKLREHSNFETLCFVLMGLVVLLAIQPLYEVVKAEAIVWLAAEGVCYLTGAVCYTLHNRRYMHSVFHFLVLAGSVCHIVAVWDMLRVIL